MKCLLQKRKKESDFHPILSLARSTENHPYFRLIIPDTPDCQQLKHQPTTINSNPPTKHTMNASKTAKANSRHKILSISMKTPFFLPLGIIPHLHSSKQPSKFLGV
ncbi:hypothetical protein [Ligilactobacillus ruminis]|uniref:hypothetical protein n=1 Tax=Ligilactobacillus ruminis TaxID=1623 RepID=UPI0022E401CE|nr:hypothetical protein [Ligilactobacillus ruminis]